jgi:myo-inositol-1(or 4)-monophosphatase
MLPNNVISEIKNWMQTAGQLAITKQSAPRVQIKADRTLVTDVEHRIEELLIDKIQHSFPGHQILAEESGLIGPDHTYLWTIDPIDGTKPYLRGLPVWSISLALLDNGAPLAGFVFLPALNDFLYGGTEGVFWNDKKLQLSSNQMCKDELLFLAVSSNCRRYYDISYPRIQAYGSTIFHLVCLVRGLAVGALIRRVNLWDFASLLPIFISLGISIEYVSHRALDLAPLLKGQKTDEDLLAAPVGYLEQLHKCILPKATK